MKKCSHCKKNKPVTAFVRSKNRPDGRYPICKSCKADYYAANRERTITQTREYRARPGNRERIGEWNRAYAKRRFFFTRACALRQKANGAESASYLELATLWKTQRGRCVMTDRILTRENAHLDHIVPLVRGGWSTISNLRWVHKDFNYAKRDLSDADFLDLCKDVVAVGALLSESRKVG